MKSSRRHFLKAGLLAPFFVGTANASKYIVTPPEVEGPFYPVTAQKDKDFDLTKVQGQKSSAQGTHLEIHGRVVDQQGVPIEDAVVDIWQANTFGRYRHPADTSQGKLDPGFQGWAIVSSANDGSFRFKTIKPGAYKVTSNWFRPPHIHFKVSKRGYEELTTQMYFPDEPLNKVDKLLLRQSEEARETMISRLVSEQTLPVYNYQVVLQKA